MTSNEHSNNDHETLLSDSDPAPFTLIEADSPLILNGPHNAYFVPQSLYTGDRPLGLHPSTFHPRSPFKRHEACDWGMLGLFTALQRGPVTGTKHCNYISGNYSRLVTDLNRIAKDSIAERSEETFSPVPGNRRLTDIDKNKRIKEVYDPYHKELKSLIKRKQKKFGYTIFLDLHSFTSVWQHENRKVDIGTLAFYDNPIEEAMAGDFQNLCEEKALQFNQHAPYNLNEAPERVKGAAFKIQGYGAVYTGLEFSNDLLDTPPKTKTIARILQETIRPLMAREDKSIFAQP